MNSISQWFEKFALCNNFCLLQQYRAAHVNRMDIFCSGLKCQFEQQIYVDGTDVHEIYFFFIKHSLFQLKTMNKRTIYNLITIINNAFNKLFASNSIDGNLEKKIWNTKRMFAKNINISSRHIHRMRVSYYVKQKAFIIHR